MVASANANASCRLGDAGRDSERKVFDLQSVNGAYGWGCAGGKTRWPDVAECVRESPSIKGVHGVWL